MTASTAEIATTLDDLRRERDTALAKAPRYDQQPWNDEQRTRHQAWVDAEVAAAQQHIRELMKAG